VLIESLIRLGRPFVGGKGSSQKDVLRQVSDVDANEARNFLANVFVVEIDRSEGFRAAALPVQQWGEYKPSSSGSKKIFTPDVDRAVGIPFILPKGGNPLVPQGRYGVAVYPFYDAHVRGNNKMKGFSDTEDAVQLFLSHRVARTVGLELSPEEEQQVANELYRVFSTLTVGKEKFLGLIVLADLSNVGLYDLSENKPIGDSEVAYVSDSVLFPGKYIVACLGPILDSFWRAKLGEGAEKGERKGDDARCFFCGCTGEVVSAYCKSVPWFATTWNCPLPLKLAEDELVESIALCATCYGALTYGASIFTGLSRRLEKWLTKEIFSPSTSVAGKELARGSSRRAEDIWGIAFALPVLDSFLEDEEQAEEFVQLLNNMLQTQSREGKLDLHLKAVTGFESTLPEEADTSTYRLNVMYFSGDFSRKDVHLRAYIEDVLPSTVRILVKIVDQTGNYALELARLIHGGDVSEGLTSMIHKQYTSIPFLLTTAFGGEYLWHTIGLVMHRQQLSSQRFLFNSARRFEELSRKLPESHWKVQGEVLFYLAFREFLRWYCEKIVGNGGDKKMRDWKELHEVMNKRPSAEFKFNDVEEIGFAAGYVVRLFARQYWYATKTGKEGKDYIKHRVMTFGSKLTPDVIFKRAL